MDPLQHSAVRRARRRVDEEPLDRCQARFEPMRHVQLPLVRRKPALYADAEAAPGQQCGGAQVLHDAVRARLVQDGGLEPVEAVGRRRVAIEHGAGLRPRVVGARQRRALPVGWKARVAELLLVGAGQRGRDFVLAVYRLLSDHGCVLDVALQRRRAVPVVGGGGTEDDSVGGEEEDVDVCVLSVKCRRRFES